jgi:hypothetical protein
MPVCSDDSSGSRQSSPRGDDDDDALDDDGGAAASAGRSEDVLEERPRANSIRGAAGSAPASRGNRGGGGASKPASTREQSQQQLKKLSMPHFNRCLAQAQSNRDRQEGLPNLCVLQKHNHAAPASIRHGSHGASSVPAAGQLDNTACIGSFQSTPMNLREVGSQAGAVQWSSLVVERVRVMVENVSLHDDCLAEQGVILVSPISLSDEDTFHALLRRYGAGELSPACCHGAFLLLRSAARLGVCANASDVGYGTWGVSVMQCVLLPSQVCGSRFLVVMLCDGLRGGSDCMLLIRLGYTPDSFHRSSLRPTSALVLAIRTLALLSSARHGPLH